MMARMVDFDLFVKTLGRHAKQYTPEQLTRLHLQVHTDGVNFRFVWGK
jgi:hypothetical protein